MLPRGSEILRDTARLLSLLRNIGAFYFIVILFCQVHPAVSFSVDIPSASTTTGPHVNNKRFLPSSQLHTSFRQYTTGLQSSPSEATIEKGDDSPDDGPVYDTPLKPPSLENLFEAAAKAAIPKGADTTDGAHDAFRFEWGRWVDDESIETLMERMNEVVLTAGVYDTLVDDDAIDNNDGNDDGVEGGQAPSTKSRRLRVAGGDHWDAILHVLPQGSEWSGRWPTGSWAVVRALTGMAEISMLRGPNRDGFYTKATKKNLRGGGDGTLAGGGTGTVGEDCIKYVGGALRCYAGKSGRTTLLEVVIRPPIGKDSSLDGDGRNSMDMETIQDDPSSVLSVIVPGKNEDEDNEEEDDDSSDGTPNHLGAKMGMTFEKVGGLDEQLDAIVRRVLASR